MRLVTYKNLWGMSGRLVDQLERVREAGYDGIEWTLPAAADEANFRAELRDLGLRYIAVVATPGPLGSPEAFSDTWRAQTATADTDHAAEYRRETERALTFQPDKLSAQIGHDAMTDADAMRLFEAALAIDQDHGVPVAHETHRRRILYTPWRTAEILRRFPELRLCADFSHWVVVAGRMLEDRATDMAIATQRSIHTQGRVGYPHGPQVSDPRAPELAHYQSAFERWWAAIIRERVAAGDAEFTFQPDYGPPEYQQVEPYTKRPVADVWDVNLWATERFRAFFRETLDALAVASADSSE